MAINNFTWTGEQWVNLTDGRNCNPTEDEAGGQVENWLRPGGLTGVQTQTEVTATDTTHNLQRNFKFAFKYGPTGPPQDKAIVSFFRQDTDSKQFIFGVDRGRMFLSMQPLQPTITPAIEATILSHAVTSAVGPTNGPPGFCYQIEFLTNGGQTTSLSTDLGNPDFPVFTVTFRASTVSCDPDDAILQLCATFDTQVIADLDPNAPVTQNEAIELFGPGAGNSILPLYNPPIPGGVRGLFYQGWFSPNRDRAGFVGQNNVGFIEPVGPEVWQGNLTNCAGWQWDLIGIDTLP